jgi:hypothetical protein
MEGRMTDRARELMRQLAAVAYEHFPPDAWGLLHETLQCVERLARAHEEAVRALEAAVARERRYREREAAMERALLLIQEEARRARGG